MLSAEQISRKDHKTGKWLFEQLSLCINKDSRIALVGSTGSGKTLIAESAIDQAMSRGERTIYTAPIKALSNQKYRDFSARHPGQVGIMTGDVTINPQAALLIMTTEIYHNALLEDAGYLSKYAWIIFDEVHYLDDIERGTVWEEAMHPWVELPTVREHFPQGLPSPSD